MSSWNCMLKISNAFKMEKKTDLCYRNLKISFYKWPFVKYLLFFSPFQPFLFQFLILLCELLVNPPCVQHWYIMSCSFVLYYISKFFKNEQRPYVKKKKKSNFVTVFFSIFWRAVHAHVSILVITFALLHSVGTLS